MAKFEKGKSGNPDGRPKGSRNKAKVRADELLDALLFGSDNKARAILEKTVSLAISGDAACIRLCLDRFIPVRRDQPVPFDMPEMKTAKDAVEAASAIVQAVASGDLTPMEASELTKVVESYSRTLQTVDFAERLEKLEKATAR